MCGRGEKRREEEWELKFDDDDELNSGVGGEEETGDGDEVETGDGGLRPGGLGEGVGGSVDGMDGVQGGHDVGVGFGRVRFDPFCDEFREVLGGIGDTLRGCGYIEGSKVAKHWGVLLKERVAPYRSSSTM